MEPKEERQSEKEKPKDPFSPGRWAPKRLVLIFRAGKRPSQQVNERAEEAEETNPDL
jgi:hypothetical protein